MRWMRFAAFVIGLVSGTVFLIYVESPRKWFSDWREALTVLACPVTLVVASLVGLKFERIAGWWLLAGSVATAVLLVVQLLPWEPGVLTLVVVPVIFCFPMLFSGSLWLVHARHHQPNGDRLPMMP